MNKIWMTVSAALFLSTPGAIAGVYEKLTPEQQRVVNSGEQVVITHDVEGSAWPKVFIYQLVASTPEEGAAVFHDYESVPSFQSDIKSAKSTAVDRATTDTDYKLDTTWADENYTMRDKVSLVENGTAYRDDWKLVRAEKMSAADGYAYFEPRGTGTFMAYYNFVNPNRFGAGLVKGKAIKSVRAAAQNLVNQVQKERTQNQPKLQQQIQALRRALGQS